MIARDDDGPSPPKPPKPHESATASSSSALPTATSSSNVPLQTLTAAKPPKGSRPLGPGESAGIGIAVAVAVLFIALAIRFFMQRRKRSKFGAGNDSAAFWPGTKHSDMEAGQKGMDSDDMDFGPVGVPEMETCAARGRRFSELAGRRSPAEMISEPHSVAELEGSNVMARYLEKKNRERLFLDPPIDENDDKHDNDSPRVAGKKYDW